MSVEVKVVILAGGLGTRLSEETEVRPKPMVEIGGHPIIWHIMKHYLHHGLDEFVVALGYKGEEIKRYFLDYYHLRNSLTIDLARGRVEQHEAEREDWRVHLIDTGPSTDTGGRIKRLRRWLGKDVYDDRVRVTGAGNVLPLIWVYGNNPGSSRFSVDTEPSGCSCTTMR